MILRLQAVSDPIQKAYPPHRNVEQASLAQSKQYSIVTWKEALLTGHNITLETKLILQDTIEKLRVRTTVCSYRN
jgi:hypothetical protein